MAEAHITLDGVSLTVDYLHQPEELELGYVRVSEYVEVQRICVGTDSQDVTELLDSRLERIEGLVLMAHHTAIEEARMERYLAKVEA